jgi:homoserine kinase type II
MAVFTPVSLHTAQSFVSQFPSISSLSSLSPIAQGIENSNYHLRSSQNISYILTLFENRVQPDDVPYFAALMDFLFQKNLPVAEVIKNNQGKLHHTLENKPCLITSFLPGHITKNPSPDQTQNIGLFLATLHNTSKDFHLKRQNSLSLPEWKKLLDPCMPLAHNVEANLERILSHTLLSLSELWPDIQDSNLPSGLCHNDLFDDNVFFSQNNQLSGVFDFYFASHELFVYDIAVTLHAWCFPNHDQLSTKLAIPLLRAYQSVRPLSPQEWNILPTIMTGAAIRFVSTRLHDWLFPPNSNNYQHKNPKDYISHLKWCLTPHFNWKQLQAQVSPS